MRGTIIGVNAVLTAAHCLYDRGEKRWSLNDEIYVEQAHFTQVYRREKKTFRK